MSHINYTFRSKPALKSGLLTHIRCHFHKLPFTAEDMHTDYGIPPWLTEYALHFEAELTFHNGGGTQSSRMIVEALPVGIRMNAIYHLFTHRVLNNLLDSQTRYNTPALPATAIDAIHRLQTLHRIAANRILGKKPEESSTDTFEQLATLCRQQAHQLTYIPHMHLLNAAAMCMLGQTPVYSSLFAKFDKHTNLTLLDDLCNLLTVSAKAQPANELAI